MSTILAIECSSSQQSVHLSFEGEPYASVVVDKTNTASFSVHSAISHVLYQAGIKAKDLSAVVVSSGPGSYTGLRIGVAAAKGISFALGIPLIGVSSLEVLAAEAVYLMEWKGNICPMMDARRQEVYLGLYDAGLHELHCPEPVVYNENFFADVVAKRTTLFCGSGMPKLKGALSQLNNAYFLHVLHPTAKWLCQLGQEKYTAGCVVDAATYEPDYLKLFDRRL